MRTKIMHKEGAGIHESVGRMLLQINGGVPNFINRLQASRYGGTAGMEVEYYFLVEFDSQTGLYLALETCVFILIYNPCLQKWRWVPRGFGWPVNPLVNGLICWSLKNMQLAYLDIHFAVIWNKISVSYVVMCMKYHVLFFISHLLLWSLLRLRWGANSLSRRNNKAVE